MRSILLNHSVSAAKIPIPTVSESFQQILPAVSKTTRRQWCAGEDSGAKFDGHGFSMARAGPHQGDGLQNEVFVALVTIIECLFRRADQQSPADLMGSKAKRLVFRIAESSSFASIFGQESMGSC